MKIIETVVVVLALGCGAGDEEAPTARGVTTPTRSEVEVPVHSLPSPIVAALAGRGVIREAEVIVSPRGVLFEVEVGNTEYLIDARGTILATEREDADAGDDNEGDTDDGDDDGDGDDDDEGDDHDHAAEGDDD